MAQNSFIPSKGKWLLKDHTLVSSAGDVEKGDMIVFSGTTAATPGVTVKLGTGTDDLAIVGIAAQNVSSSTTTTQAIKIWVPGEMKAECRGQVIAGIIALGDTDAGRTCELESHAGADVDDITHDNHLYIVKGIKAYTTDGAGTPTTCTTAHPGVAIFRIAQTPEKQESW